MRSPLDLVQLISFIIISSTLYHLTADEVEKKEEEKKEDGEKKEEAPAEQGEYKAVQS